MASFFGLIKGVCFYEKAILFMLLVGLITECGSDGNNGVNKNLSEVTKPSQVEQKTPEPYTKALASLNEGDFDLASKCLDLTVQDFKDSEDELSLSRLSLLNDLR